MEKFFTDQKDNFLFEVYDKLLVNNYSQDEVNYYTKRLSNGRSRSSIIVQIARNFINNPNHALAISCVEQEFYEYLNYLIVCDDKARNWFFEKNYKHEQKINFDTCRHTSDVKKNYIIIEFNNHKIFYDAKSMGDMRGIGRVSRSLFKSMINNGAKIANYKSLKLTDKIIYFYPSIHFCPIEIPRPNIVVIHDVVPLVHPDKFNKSIVSEWSDKYKNIAKRADQITTISSSSADDISYHLGINREEILVIKNGVEAFKEKSEFIENFNTKDYFVFLGSHDGHKNISVVFDAMELIEGRDIRLVMIGDNFSLQNEVKRRGIGDRVNFLGRLNDNDVRFLLSSSIALVFPSLYEGFGLPPFEAAKLDVPSICARRPAMTELLEGAAIFCDPLEPQEWVVAMNNLLNDAALRKKIAINAKNIADNLTWDSSAKQYLALLTNYKG